MEDVDASFFNSLKVANKYRINLENIRKEEFENLAGITYVDHAAASLYSKKQLSSIFNSLNSSVYGNPHSRHLPSEIVTQSIDAARNRIFEHFNTSSEDYDLIFTSGATDAIKIIANCFCWRLNDSNNIRNQQEPEEENRGVFVYTQENHTSVLGIREAASMNGADIYSLLSSKAYEIFKESKGSNFYAGVLNETNSEPSNIGLFAFSGQCNFSGEKYPLKWIENVHSGLLGQICEENPMNDSNKIEDFSAKSWDTKWFVLLDAASLVATSALDLSKYKPDFVPVSFYKIFGFPTGLGCLLVSKRAANYLQKNYFGGGTVQMVDSTTLTVNHRVSLHERFEDGTLPFLNILALEYGFSTLSRIAGSMKCIEDHVFNVAYYMYYILQCMRHSNMKPVVKIYSEHTLWTKETQGPIVNFNVINSSGNYVGFRHVERVASLYNIYLRTGCFCNPGACQKFLQISSLKLQHQFNAGHVCGDTIDMVDGHPTGSIRVSFGYMSTYEDADRVLQMIKDCFVDGEVIYDKNSSQTYFDSNTNDKSGNIEIELEVEDSLTLNKQKEHSYVGTKSLDRPSSISGNSKENIRHLHNKLPYKLTGIIIYPVKSCGGIFVSQWRIGSCGLEYDRQWMIVTSSGVTLTQKIFPQLSLIVPKIDFEKNILELTHTEYGAAKVDMTELENDNYQETNFCGGRVCGDRIKGYDCGDIIGDWLTKVLGIKCRLMKQIQRRNNKLLLKDGSSGSKLENLSLANESQYLIIHEASVRYLWNQIIDRGIETWITEEDLKKRFRPNLIISGGDHYEEDQWESLSIGNHRFKIHGSCPRCQMVSVVPETGQKSREPLVTLAATRGSNMKFGVHASYVDYFGNPKEIPDLLQTETSILITNKIREELYID